jgi:dienelactone hydrolase
VKTIPLNYKADDLEMAGWLYVPDGGTKARPAVLVFPEAFGLGSHAKQKAERLADNGFVALACDLHGGGRNLKDLAEVMEVLGPIFASPKRMRARASGAFDALKARTEVDGTRIAAIGYCFGGTLALELARSGAPIVAAAGFHSGLATAVVENKRDQLKARILACSQLYKPGRRQTGAAAGVQVLRECRCARVGQPSRSPWRGIWSAELTSLP